MGLIVGGDKGGIFGSIINVFSLLFKLKGVLSITLVLLLITSFSAISESWREKSIIPAIKTVGGMLVGHDTKLYTESSIIEKQGGLIVVDKEGNTVWWEFIKSLSVYLTQLWYIYFWGFVFYKIALLITNNSSAVASNLAMMLLFLVVIQIFFNFLIILEVADLEVPVEIEDMPIAKQVIPFKGVYKFISTIPLLFKEVGSVPYMEPNINVSAVGG